MSAGYWSGDVAALDATPSLVQRPANKYAVMLFHGGDGDSFEENTILPTVTAYDAAIRKAASVPYGGHFRLLCDHGRGHVVPTDSSAGTRRFFDDHPYGTVTSPYGSGALPSAIPAYCTR